MKTRKRLLSILLMLAMLVSMFTVMAFADDEPTGEAANAEEYYVKIKVLGSDSGANGYAAINETKYTSENETKVSFNSWNDLNQAYLSVLCAAEYKATVSVDKNGLTLSANGGNLNGDFNGATITVKFEKTGDEPTPPATKTHNVWVLIEGSEYGTVKNGDAAVQSGSVITLADDATVNLTATPKENCTVSWKLEDATTTTSDQTTFALKEIKNENALLTITFTSKTPEPAQKYALTLAAETVSGETYGKIKYNSEEKTSFTDNLAKDAVVKAEAVAKSGYKFVKWEAVGITLTERQQKNPSLSFKMPANEVKLTAKFEEEAEVGDCYLKVNIWNESYGTVSFRGDSNVDDGEWFKLTDGKRYTISATPSRGYKAVWYYDGESYTGNSFTFKMDEDVDDIYVEFVKKGSPSYDDDSHTLTIDITGAKHGTVKRGSTTVKDGDTMSLDKNETRTFKATPDKGYVAVWTFRGETYVGNSYTVKMGSKNATLYVEFMDEDDYRLTKLPFRDVSEKDWYYDDVAYVYRNGYMEGISSTKFAPSQNTTRGQIVTILWRLTGEPRATRSNKFTDVSSSMYYDKAISWAAEAGIVDGFDAKTFKPDANVTREQLAAILYRYAEYMNLSTKGKANLTKYDDYSKIGSWAKDAMAWANYHGLINGVTSYRIDPKGYATRAQIAAILHRFAVEFGA